MHPEWHIEWFTSPCIDLRSSDAFIRQHITQTTSIPWDRLVRSMHELPDKHQQLQLLGEPSELEQARSFLLSKGYQISNTIVACEAFWHWAATQQLLDSGCHSVPLWRANPLLERAIEMIEQHTDGRTALDLACGAGRDSVFLARRGWDVTAIDNKSDALQRCQSLASANACKVSTRQIDLEAEPKPLGQDSYDLIIVMRYLYRPLLSQLSQHLNPDGLLCYSTFMVGSEQYGSPRNPNYLLKPDELSQTYPQMNHLIDDTVHLSDGRPVSYFLAQKVISAQDCQ